MSTENVTTASAPASYGYASDEVKQSPFNFGLNAGVTVMDKFEWIPNGGVDGAEQEALNINFNIGGTDKSYRMFPVTSAFSDNNQKVTDPNSKEMRDAITDFNARITHILHCYLDSDTIKAGFSIPIKDFKQFCQVAASMLPKDYDTKVLDVFMQYGWELGDKDRTYLDLPKKMKYGKWLIQAVPGKWTVHKVENPDESMKKALWYTNENNEEHPFTKNGWFMSSHFAVQQRSGNEIQTAAAATATQVDGATNAAKKSTW